MPVELSPLGADRFDGWHEDVKQRLIARSRESGMRAGDDAIDFAEAFLRDLLPQGPATSSAGLFVLVESSQELGALWLADSGGKLFLVDLGLSVDLDARQREELFSTIRRIAVQREAKLISVALFPQDAQAHALIAGRGFAVASIQMLLEPLPERRVAPHVVVSPMTAERFRRFAEHSEASYAEDLVAAGRYTADEAVIESRRQMRLELPEGIDTPGQELFTASVDGAEVGVLWLGLRRRDGRPHAFILDIEVAQDQRRRGYGRELMHAAEREARRMGAESIGLHVFGFNTGAIDLYESLGYRRVEETFLLHL
ncbi:N-acetyltransferase family protein [Microbacterium hydrocarbonoxydans]|uniref:GNAT family N-acetyltransferase n=1 Tax=Microbacterium hydrocarbonoxydans TaxID=273678 RepID=UPI003D957FB6